MMSLEALIAEIKRLPIKERLELVNMITSSLQEELATKSPRIVDWKQIAGIIAPEDAQQMRDAIEEDCERIIEPPTDSSLRLALGILATEGPIPTDEELMEDYINYLIEKYK